MSRDQAKLLERARQFERNRENPAAIELYLNAGANQEAARLLAAQGDFLRAATVVLSPIGTNSGHIKQLDSAQRKLAFLAATYLVKAGNGAAAADLLVALGENQRAAELLEQRGDLAGANAIREGRCKLPDQIRLTEATESAKLGRARRLESEGKFELAIATYAEARAYSEAAQLAYRIRAYPQAARFYTEAGKPYQAAQCYVTANDLKMALEVVVKTSRQGPEYRSACLLAVQLAAKLNELTFPLENMLTRFVTSGPRDAKEAEAFLALARLYREHDFPENALEAYRRLLDFAPNHAAARQELNQLEQHENVAMRMQMGHVVREQAAFRGDEPVRGPKVGRSPPSPDLPGLPELPARGPAASPSASPSPLPATPVAQPGPAQPANQTMAVWSTAAVAPHQGTNRQTPQESAPQQPPGLVGQGRTQYGTGLKPPPAPHHSQVAPGYEPTLAPAATQHLVNPPLVAGTGAGPLVLEAGSVVASRYRLEQKIGEGGMAAVFRATDLELGEQIALKVFTSPVQNEEMVARFKQELKLTRKLSHPNIIRLFDIGVFQGFRYISMELLEGTSLEGILRGPVHLGRGISLLRQACAGLQAAHTEGVIHRDVKPENFFVTSNDLLKVMDFGIAKQQSGPTFTVVGRIAGTPAYMCPEQINNFSSVTAASDIYALGVVAYRMFAGVLPFDHQDLMALLMMHINDDPARPRQHNPHIPERLEQIILKAMAKKPDERFASCNEFSTALKSVPT